jgi:Prolipoprotein diacylglyceryltransferase
MSSKLPQMMYGLAFVVLVPLGLVVWAHESCAVVSLPVLHSVTWGAAIVAIGALAMLAGTLALWRYGGGLPMNAFPPPRLVEKGAYQLVPHPIYGGFVLACAGVAVWSGSASAFWLVTPCAALCCAALVLGYELPDLRKRFGVPTTSCWLPRDSDNVPTLLERYRVYFVVLFPWLAIYELMGAMGRPSGTVATYLPFEKHWPVIAQAEVIYASTYVVVSLAPLLLMRASAMRRFALFALRAMAVNFILYLLLPVFVQPRPCDGSGWLGWWMHWERGPYAGCAAFPSFHVTWAFIAASALAGRKRWAHLLWWTWAALVAVSCIATGMHSIADVLAGAMVFWLVANMDRMWRALLRYAERVANSWREWRFGPVRIMNHGGYNAAAVFVGATMIASLLGQNQTLVVISIFLCSVLCAVLWAQLVEGSSVLLRPMGFYGGFLGAIIGTIPGILLGANIWTLLAAVAVAGPWIQALGRLRCLVQGCCHGRPTSAENGICYTHPRTRVCRLTNLDGVPIHATQLYSILYNVVLGMALIRLIAAHASCTMICGVYLILSSAARFVEEAYRGEPQTRIIWNLHVYQWIAIVCLVAGVVIIAIQTNAALPVLQFHWNSLMLGIFCGAIAWFVSGVDFPDSSRRFARLT